MATESYFWTEKQDNGNTRLGLNDNGRDDLGQVSFIDVPAVGTKLTNGCLLYTSPSPRDCS